MCFRCEPRCKDCLYVNEGWKDGKGHAATVVKKMCEDCLIETDLKDTIAPPNRAVSIMPMGTGLHQAILDLWKSL